MFEADVGERHPVVALDFSTPELVHWRRRLPPRAVPGRFVGLVFGEPGSEQPAVTGLVDLSLFELETVQKRNWGH